MTSSSAPERRIPLAAERAAWEAYVDVLADLRGREYAEAEPVAWTALHEELDAIAERLA